MRLRNSAEGYGSVSQMMHWITVVLVILAWLLGQFDDVFPKGAARAAGLFVHISAGLAVIGILVMRLFWRFADPPPPIEHTILGAWLDRAGQLREHRLQREVALMPRDGARRLLLGKQDLVDLLAGADPGDNGLNISIAYQARS